MNYPELFKQLKQENPDDAILYGDYILVRVLPDEEIQTKSGIVFIADSNQRLKSFNSNKPVFCEVLQPGEGFEDEEGELIPLAATRGDVVVVGQNAPLVFTRFGRIPMNDDLQLAMIRESEIIFQFPGAESYERYFNTLEKLLDGNRSQ